MVPNAFIAYRMTLIREYRNKNKNIKLPRMGDFSRIAEDSWNKEPQHRSQVLYQETSRDKRRVYCDAKSNIVPIQDNAISTSRSSHIINNSFQEQIRILQEYVRILEQTIDCLLIEL
ncbi:hypothetical protein GLOIN_2v1784135 [Rhizophagus clarus]|uniref:HMG box domain-containing protein n=1 Tax=Rhizophagus clarus TaxID=94130 RepID=A0A8H3M2M1_9GLOM|nr:hypothetical protein GLOIN_2v1784135 [Rhizophagus clarus]